MWLDSPEDTALHRKVWDALAASAVRDRAARTPTTHPRALLTVEASADVVATVQDNNPGMSTAIAGRIVNEALAYVATAARHPDAYLAPSRTVDEGWHALILHTAVYAGLCEQLGVFVHHFPERPDPFRHDDAVMERTLTLIRGTDHTPDLSLWMPPADNRIPVAASGSHTPRPGRCSPIEPRPRPPKPPQPGGAA